MWPPRQRTECRPCSSQAKHVCISVSALLCSPQALVPWLWPPPLGDLFPCETRSFSVCSSSVRVLLGGSLHSDFLLGRGGALVLVLMNVSWFPPHKQVPRGKFSCPTPCPNRQSPSFRRASLGWQTPVARSNLKGWQLLKAPSVMPGHRPAS